MNNLDFLLEDTDMDLLDIVESEILQEYKISDAILNKNKLKDEEYVKRQIKNIKENNAPVTPAEAIALFGTSFTVGFVTLNPWLVVLANAVLSRIIAGGFTQEKWDEKSKKRMLDSIDKAIKQTENAKPKNDEDKKRLESELEKLKKNRELIEKKLK